MALMSQKIGDIPDDAIRLTPEQALTYEWKVISGWQNWKDVWALRYGPGALGFASALTGIFINQHYRRKLKLGTYGQLSSYLPIIVLPAMMTTIFHKVLVQQPVILNTEPCPVCLEVRATSLQALFGIVYPVILAPLSAFVFATRHFTYRLPSITEQPKEVFNLWRKLTKPLGTTIGIGLGFHTLVAIIVTFKEMENYYKLQAKLIEEEDRIINS